MTSSLITLQPVQGPLLLTCLLYKDKPWAFSSASNISVQLWPAPLTLGDLRTGVPCSHSKATSSSYIFCVKYHAFSSTFPVWVFQSQIWLPFHFHVCWSSHPSVSLFSMCSSNSDSILSSSGPFISCSALLKGLLSSSSPLQIHVRPEQCFYDANLIISAPYCSEDEGQSPWLDGRGVIGVGSKGMWGWRTGDRQMWGTLISRMKKVHFLLWEFSTWVWHDRKLIWEVHGGDQD